MFESRRGRHSSHVSLMQDISPGRVSMRGLSAGQLRHAISCAAYFGCTPSGAVFDDDQRAKNLALMSSQILPKRPQLDAIIYVACEEDKDHLRFSDTSRIHTQTGLEKSMPHQTGRVKITTELFSNT